MKTLSIAILSLATLVGSIPPAGAFPTTPQIVSPATDIQPVQFQYERGEARKNRSSCAVPYCEFNGRRGYDGDRHGYYRDGYYRDRYRRHYRHDDDVGALIGGLAAGAVIGGLLAQPRYYNEPRAVGGDAHTRWCYARYRSYRAWDNSYQPYSGRRRACYSPY